MDPFTLRILHVSGLHERGPREGEPWRRRRVLSSAWEANLDALCAGGAPQLVCFTGDTADLGAGDGVPAGQRISSRPDR